MNRSHALAFAIVLCTSTFCHGAVSFFEGFENPALGDLYLEIETGPATFDNSGWEILNTSAPGDDEVGVFIDNNFLFPGGTQVLGLGGGEAVPPNTATIMISGFTGALLPSIMFDYFSSPPANQVQGIRVTVVDPNNGDSILYDSGDLAGLGSGIVSTDFGSSPLGDVIRLTIEQTGDPVNSDSAIDNIFVTAVPEPSRAVVSGLGVIAALLYRRRRRIR